MKVPVKINGVEVGLERPDETLGDFFLRKEREKLDREEEERTSEIKEANERERIYKEEKEKRMKEVTDILSSNGIEMSVGGCGCCESPWVTFTYKGRRILDDEYNANFATETLKED